MKIIVERDFKDRHTKKIVKAGTIVEADETRLSLLDKRGIKYEFVEESVLDGNVNQVKKAITADMNKCFARTRKSRK